MTREIVQPAPLRAFRLGLPESNGAVFIPKKDNRVTNDPLQKLLSQISVNQVDNTCVETNYAQQIFVI